MKTELPRLFGLTPRRTGGSLLWKKGAFEARAYPSSVPIRNSRECYWLWNWTIGSSTVADGRSVTGVDGCLVALEDSLRDEKARTTWKLKQLRALLKKEQ